MKQLNQTKWVIEFETISSNSNNNICFAWGWAKWMSSRGTGSDAAMRINGLPYSADGDQACGSLVTQYNDDANQNLCCFINNNILTCY